MTTQNKKPQFICGFCLKKHKEGKFFCRQEDINEALK